MSLLLQTQSPKAGVKAEVATEEAAVASVAAKEIVTTVAAAVEAAEVVGAMAIIMM